MVAGKIYAACKAHHQQSTHEGSWKRTKELLLLAEKRTWKKKPWRQQTGIAGALDLRTRLVSYWCWPPTRIESHKHCRPSRVCSPPYVNANTSIYNKIGWNWSARFLPSDGQPTLHNLLYAFKKKQNSDGKIDGAGKAQEFFWCGLAARKTLSLGGDWGRKKRPAAWKKLGGHVILPTKEEWPRWPGAKRFFFFFFFFFFLPSFPRSDGSPRNKFKHNRRASAVE